MSRLNEIREAILKLTATGPLGFEGLLGAVLEKVAGQPFRLARSGIQAGRDGDTAAVTSHISYECKLYTSALSSADVQAKITQLAGSADPPDVWALAATVEAGSQLVGTLQAAATRFGLGVLILDWPATSAYPPLAVALAMAVDTTADFLETHVDNASLIANAKVALDALRAMPDFDRHAQAIASEVRTSSLGMANATVANQLWLSDKFSDRPRREPLSGRPWPSRIGALAPLPEESSVSAGSDAPACAALTVTRGGCRRRGKWEILAHRRSLAGDGPTPSHVGGFRHRYESSGGLRSVPDFSHQPSYPAVLRHRRRSQSQPLAPPDPSLVRSS